MYADITDLDFMVGLVPISVLKVGSHYYVNT